MKKYWWSLRTYWKGRPWMDKISFGIGAIFYALFALVMVLCLIIAGYGVWYQNGTAMFMGVMGALIFVALMILPYLCYQQLTKAARTTHVMKKSLFMGMLRGMEIFTEMFKVLEDVRRRDKAYDAFKQHREINRLAWDDIRFYSAHATEDVLFWDKVKALLNENHPRHMEYIILAGCLTNKDEALMYTALQQWWDEDHNPVQKENIEECDVYL